MLFYVSIYNIIYVIKEKRFFVISGIFLSYSILGWKQLKVSNPYPATIFWGPENVV